jgi:hypothetical protein
MAQLIMCDSACGTPALVMWTVIENGDVQAYCAPCLAEVCAGIAQQTGMIDGLVAAKVMELIAAGDLKEVKRRKPAEPGAEPEPGPGAGAGPFDPPPADETGQAQ